VGRPCAPQFFIVPQGKESEDMRMRRWLWSAGLLAAVGLGAGCAHDEAKQARHRGEVVGEAFAQKVRFADQLSLLNQKQITLGHLALQRSGDPEVRRFAVELIRDHQRNQEDLETLAESKALSLARVDLSTAGLAIGGAGTEGALEGVEKGEKKYNKQYDQQVQKFLEKRDELAGLRGREFDKAFLEQVRGDQDRARELVEEGLHEYRDDTTLAVFLGRTAPVLSSHLRRAELLEDSLGE
jgi:putative membrane protein